MKSFIKGYKNLPRNFQREVRNKIMVLNNWTSRRTFYAKMNGEKYFGISPDDAININFIFNQYGLDAESGIYKNQYAKS